MKILAAGDGFVTTKVLTGALVGQDGLSEAVDVSSIQSNWPNEPYSDFSGVKEAFGNEDDLIAALGEQGVEVVDGDLDRHLVERRHDPDAAVIARAERDDGAPADREGEDEPVVVVGVLADEVDAAGRGPEAHGVGGGEGGEQRAGGGCGGGVGHSWTPSMAARSFSAAVSGGTSPIQAPMAASDPARNLSLSAARRGLVSCRCRRAVSRATCTGA